MRKAGGYLKTHDFLQPLERVGKNIAKEENRAEAPTVETPQPPAPPPSSVEHILPGGIGTYSISHISYINQRVPKPEGVMYAVATAAAQASSSDRNDDNSNCSSYTGSGFTLWEESVVMKKGQTGKENNIVAAERQYAVRGIKILYCYVKLPLFLFHFEEASLSTCIWKPLILWCPSGYSI